MHDPKFEKEVQERMDGLQFNPSDQVWIRLEQELNKGKRRPLPLFWLFILVGGMLIGAGGTWFFFGRNGQTIVAQQAASQPAVPQPAASQLTGSQTAGSPSVVSQFSHPHSASRPSAPYNLSSATSQTASSRPFPGPASGTVTEGPMEGIAQTQPGETKLVPDGGLSGSPIRTGLARIRSWLNPSAIPPPAMAASPSTAKKAIMYKRPVWQAGFTGGLGVSSLEESFLRQTIVPRSNGLTTPAGITYGGSPQPNAFINPKESADLSFWAGVFVQKPIGKRLSISAGLNLHYYSTRISTGQQVTANSNYPTPSLFYASAVAASSQSYPYYPPGDNYNYVNRYYFLEVPLSIQWQFNRSDRLPLFLEGGVAASRLMSVNALYYNESSGVYYKFGTPSANPLQLFSSAAVLAGLRWGSTRIQFGPQIQYGLTSLSKANTGPAQHFLYGGLKLIVIPGWK